MQDRGITLTVNGQSHDLSVKPSMLLRDVLRDKLNLTGAKRGCDEGMCGACTVIMNGQAVKSCMVLAVEANGKNILTIEGLAQNGTLHPLQQSFMDHFAVQCGFCSPGMILTALTLLHDESSPTEDEVRLGIVGNLCRCTGYVKIVQAIMDVAAGQYGPAATPS
ncbi:MAG: (2Fe-2S)-binding protein [Chloroflexi bacterium]|nr:(2Fe-2S)-binding protein [Chloroflexota bacterium]